MLRSICVEDQLTLLPPKTASSDYDSCGSNRLDRCSISIERILNRLETVHLLLEYLHISAASSEPSYRSYPEVLYKVSEELFYRMMLLKMGCSIKSMLVENDFVTVIGSDVLCRRISKDK